MTTFDQELTGRYVAAGGDRPDLDARRVARAVFVRDTIRTLYNADKKFGIDPPTTARWPSSSTQPKNTSSTSPTTSASGQ
ncbi:hypothetical protein [Nocardioides pelophilus]|uniref:hypothetical protein n=1 Tax=Nocardioides pelophilus TaxID=2172019 RepID=UPI0016023FA9|nr:hypothetical protein [Nocardioides pelophilus]